jgi:8-oxo-dGTP diphosphatase
VSVAIPDKIVDVAAAVILKPDGEFLFARRPEGKAYAGYWEFPGGKVEPGERVEQALVREIREELGVELTRAYPWLTHVFAYPHATVRLHFYRVTAWRGEPHPHEGQIFSWQRPQAPDVAPILPANGPILRALCLPPVMGISNVAGLGIGDFLVRLEAALRRGLRLIQLRERRLSAAEFELVARQAIDLAHRFGARILINGEPELAARLGADGAHFTAARLMGLALRPPLAWCGASCHTREEMDHAARLGLDYVVLGPVLPTLSHPGSSTLGWQRFAALARNYPLPVYAIGGLREDLLPTAWEQGAHGIAMLRGAW